MAESPEILSSEVSVYCDESSHLENDKHDKMVLGAIWCPSQRSRTFCRQIRAIKKRHGLKPTYDAKWGKASQGAVHFYEDLIDYFFANPELHFRALIVSDKTKLHHHVYHQNHDTWYYKMYFTMLSQILAPETVYYIYVDIKDTRSQDKLRKLQEVLGNSVYDFNSNIVKVVQSVRSHEVDLVQLADIFSGALNYLHRGLDSSPVKQALIERIRKHSHYSLTKTTLLKETKFNLFVWTPTSHV